MKLARVLLLFVGLFAISPSVFGASDSEIRSNSWFAGGRSSCDERIKHASDANNQSEVAVKHRVQNTSGQSLGS